MKTALLTVLIMTSVSGMALAADKSTDVNSGTFAVEKVICSKIYVPATGTQSPTYQAGMDVHGKPVVPADVAPSVNAEPDYVEVPMTVDLAQRMNLANQGAELNMPVANLKLYKDGRVEYNGQDISSNASSMCGYGKKSEVVPMSAPSSIPDMSNVEPAAGQDPMIVAPSETINPDTTSKYQADSVAPENFEPQSASAVSSTTSPPPKIDVQVQRQTVNKATRAQ